MGDRPPRELISLADDEGNGVSVNVLGRSPGWTAGLDAEIVVKTPFVSGRIDLALYVARLESWADALDRLDAGDDVAWMAMSSGPSIFIQLTGERDCPEVIVEDESGRRRPNRTHPLYRLAGAERLPRPADGGFLAGRREPPRGGGFMNASRRPMSSGDGGGLYL